MEFRDYVRVVTERWVVLASVTLLGVLAGLGFAVLTPKSYSAQAKLFVAVTAQNTSTNGSAIYSASQFVLQRMSSYALLADSGQVLRPVIRQLDLTMSVRQLSDEISVVNPTQTVVLDINVADSSADRAATIANAVGDTLGTTIESLEAAGHSISPVQVTVTKRATVDNTPVSPRRTLDILLGLVVGLVLGLAAAVLRSRFDGSLRRAQQVREVTQVPLLGRVRDDAKLFRSPLDFDDASVRDDSEAFRALRNNLTLANNGVPPKRLVVTSASSHEGRTVVACNLAIAAVAAGLRVCLVEGDLRRPQVAKYLGLHATSGLSSVLAGRTTLDEVLVEPEGARPAVLTAGARPTDPGDLLNSPAMTRLLRTLTDRFDVVVIDTPPVTPVSDAVSLARAAGGVLLVARYGRTRLSLLGETVETLRAARVNVLGSVFVGLPKNEWRRYSYIGVETAKA